MKERRQSVRVPLIARIAIDLRREAELAAVTYDISTGGINIAITEDVIEDFQLARSKPISVRFERSGDEVEAMIRRVEPDEARKRCRCGLQFVEPLSLKALSNLLREYGVNDAI